VDPATAAAHFRSFGHVAGPDSPLYAQVSEVIAGSPELLALSARSTEQTPMVFLAAVHDELLRDPGHALAAYYPTVGGEGPGAGLAEALTAFCAEREERIAATLVTRTTQTNETARCSALLPAFAAVGDGRPLALIEMGASAGLNLRWDRYAYDYGGGRTAGAAASPLTIACELVGPNLPPLDPPPVSWRVGLDLSPIDASDPADARWLRACLWPDQLARQARLAAALAIAREHPVEVRRGDALSGLPGLIAEAPADALVCVFHTAVVAYFTPEQIEGLRALLEAADRDVAWIAGEASGLLVEDPRPEGARLGRSSPGWARNFGLGFALTVGPPGALVKRGRMGHHGGWLEWLG
jgi:hypothetical protein